MIHWNRNQALASSGLWNLQTRFAQTIDKMLDILELIPLGVFPTHHGGKIGTEGKQILHSLVRSLTLTELSKRGSQRCLGVEKAGHINANRRFKRLCVFTLTIGMGESGEAQHARIIGIHLHCRFDHLTTSLQLAGMMQKQSKDADDGTIHGIERQCPLYGCVERSFLLAEEVDPGERVMAESMGRRKIDGALRRGQGTFQGFGQEIEAVRVL